jgi:hypothetical protein
MQRPDTGLGGALRYRSSGLCSSDPELRPHPEAVGMRRDWSGLVRPRGVAGRRRLRRVSHSRWRCQFWAGAW